MSVVLSSIMGFVYFETVDSSSQSPMRLKESPRIDKCLHTYQCRTKGGDAIVPRIVEFGSYAFQHSDVFGERSVHERYGCLLE